MKNNLAATLTKYLLQDIRTGTSTKGAISKALGPIAKTLHESWLSSLQHWPPFFHSLRISPFDDIARHLRLESLFGQLSTFVDCEPAMDRGADTCCADAGG